MLTRLICELHKPASVLEGRATLLVEAFQRDIYSDAGIGAHSVAQPIDAECLRSERVHGEIPRKHAILPVVEDPATTAFYGARFPQCGNLMI